MGFISPKVAIQEGWVSGIVDEDKQVQPNALDFTLDKLFTINENNTFVISEGGKQMRGGEEIFPIEDRSDNNYKFWTLQDQTYDGMSDMFVKLPEGVAAQLVVRSTLNRNGVFITSGLYDSGFEGHIGFAIHARNGTTKIAQGTRVGQLIFVTSDSVGTYAGGWNHSKGTHHSEEK